MSLLLRAATKPVDEVDTGLVEKMMPPTQNHPHGLGLRPLAWGRLYQRLDRAEPILREAVDGRRVWDMGAGAGAHAHYLLDLGAASVVAVEKERRHQPKEPRAGLEWRQATFQDLHYDTFEMGESIDVAFLAYPLNYAVPNLALLLLRARNVVYFGANDGGTACGWPDLFMSFLDRPVEAHVTWERPREALTVYGPRTRTRRGLEQYTDEERFVLEGGSIPF